MKRSLLYKKIVKISVFLVAVHFDGSLCRNFFWLRFILSRFIIVSIYFVAVYFYRLILTVYFVAMYLGVSPILIYLGNYKGFTPIRVTIALFTILQGKYKDFTPRVSYLCAKSTGFYWFMTPVFCQSRYFEKLIRFFSNI